MFTTLKLASALLCASFVAPQPVQEPAKVGDQAPFFSLPDSSGRGHKLPAYTNKFIVLEWTNKDCPYVKKFYDTRFMQDMQVKLRGVGVVWFTICSSAQGKQGYMTTDEIQKHMAAVGSNATAYLMDVEGKVGRMYGAKTTPQAVIIDPKGKIIYYGAIDDKNTTNPEDVKKARNHVLAALAEAMAGRPVSVPSSMPYGTPVRY